MRISPAHTFALFKYDALILGSNIYIADSQCEIFRASELIIDIGYYK